MAKIGVLSDHFNQGAVNTNLWQAPASVGTPAVMGTVNTLSLPTTFTPSPPFGSSAFLTLDSHAMVPTLKCSGSISASGVESVVNYDLTGSGISVQLAQYVAGSNNAGFTLANGSDQVQYYLNHVSGKISVGYEVSGSWSWPYEVTYSAAEFAYLRIREASGTVYFDHSPDGVNWTNDFNTSDPFDLTDVQVKLWFSGSSGSISWAKVNYVL